MHSSRLGFSRIMTAFFAAVIGIMLIQNYTFVNQSFISSVISVIIGIALLFVCIIPSLIVKHKTDLGFIGFARRETPTFMIFLSMFYALYFVYAAVNFLLQYSNAFTSTSNRNASGPFVIFILLAVCVYASAKGIGPLAGCSLFVFVFAIISFALIFGGNISHLDFSYPELDFNAMQLQYSIPVFSLPVFAASVFGFFEYRGKIKTKNVLWFIFGIALVLLLIVVFVFFALGQYGTMQSCQIFVLSKAAELGDMGGVDSFYLSLCAMSVFVLVSLCLICIGRVVEREENIWCMVVFSAVAYVLYLTADYYNSVKEIILNPYVFVVFTVLASFVLPIIYITVFRRRLNA